MNVEQEINNFIRSEEKIDLLRFITCGSVDDGKSTLIGRMLYEAQLIFDDQAASLEKDSKRSGTQDGKIDFALLVDGLSAEREQGITIDVAYRYFNTEKRKFIVADTPGHEEYTRNMVTGASTADVAVILIDASQGILTQTRRHAFISSLLGIEDIVLAINKMDLVGFSRKEFDNIFAEFSELETNFQFSSVTPIPMSALHGDNIIERSKEMTWYQGPTLLGFLETVKVGKKMDKYGFRFPIQWVNRPNSTFRGFAGKVFAGKIKKGEEIRALPSGQISKVKDIILYDKNLSEASTDQSVTITLENEIDLSRGDLIVSGKEPCEVSDYFEADIVWMDQEPGYVGRRYSIQLGTCKTNASLTDIKFKYDINSFKHLSCRELQLNEIASVQVSLDSQIPFESYENCAGLGSFILVDQYTNATVAAGMIRFSLRRASNIHYQKLQVNRQERERLSGHKGLVVWLTGLSGSGKSTIASEAEKKLNLRGYRTYILDGDNIRQGLSRDLGFSVADRVENIRRIAEVAKLMMDAGIIVITAFISPFRAERDMAKQMFENNDFLEVFIDTPLSVAEARDPKGLYRKARKGNLPNFTGIDSKYEIPLSADLIVQTEEKTVAESTEPLIALIMDQSIKKL